MAGRAARARPAARPERSWGHIVGVGAVAGIGFTVSLFVTGLAFDDVGLQDDAKLGTLTASIVAALAGWAVFARVHRTDS